MAIQRTLEMDFMSQLNKTHRIRVYDAKESLSPEEIGTVMDQIITSNIFSGTGGELIGKVGARLVVRETTEMDFI